MPKSLFEPGRVAVIGVPSSAGARRRGQELAPAALRSAGLLERLREVGLDVVDLGDCRKVEYRRDAANPRRQNLPLVVEVLRDVERLVELALARRARPLILGGDCTITLAVLAALSRRTERLGLLYFDGDLDLNTPDTTQSGILDGMVLAHVLGNGEDALSRFGDRYPLLTEKDIALFAYSEDGGGIDPIEIDLLQDSRMAKYPLADVIADTPGVARAAREHLQRTRDHFVVHFDIDVIDYDDLPTADVPHRPGLPLENAVDALGIFLRSDQAAGLVVTEFNAADDPEARWSPVLAASIAAAMATPLPA